MTSQFRQNLIDSMISYTISLVLLCIACFFIFGTRYLFERYKAPKEMTFNQCFTWVDKTKSCFSAGGDVSACVYEYNPNKKE